MACRFVGFATHDHPRLQVGAVLVALGARKGQALGDQVRKRKSDTSSLVEMTIF